MDNERIFDIRALKQRLRTGRLTWEQYQAYLDELPDEAEEATETEVHFSPSWAQRHQDGDDVDVDVDVDEVE